MDKKTASWFAYLLSILSAIIVLVMEKTERSVRLHAWQSLFLGCVLIVINIILSIIGAALLFTGGLFVIPILSWLIWLGYIAVTVICIIKATQDDMFKIPVIYNWAEKMK